MTDKPSGAKKFGLAGIGALLAGLLVVIGKQATKDDSPRPPRHDTAITSTGRPDTTGTTGVPVDPPADTRPMVEVGELDTEGSGLEIVTTTVAGVGRRRAVIPAGCSDESVKRALAYSKEPGYEYLARRCDLLHRWLTDGKVTHVTQWLCEQNFNSPAWSTPYVIEAELPGGWQQLRYDRMLVENGHGDFAWVPMDAAHVEIIEGNYNELRRTLTPYMWHHLDPSVIQPDRVRTLEHVPFPCWKENAPLVRFAGRSYEVATR